MSGVAFDKSQPNEYTRLLFLDAATRAQFIECQRERLAEITSGQTQFRDELHQPGISVILPTYDGSSRICTALDSLVSQTLDRSLFEVVCVINGIDNGTSKMVSSYQSAHPTLNIRWIYRREASAGAARNMGLELARHEYITFLDDDDALQPRYLERAFDIADKNRIVLSPIHDVFPDQSINTENALNLKIQSIGNRPESVTEVSWALGFNACKLIHHTYALAHRYQEDLSSGEDLVYFANFVTYPDLTVVAVTDSADAAYMRHLRASSVSRQSQTFEFSVKQRLQCIAALNEISPTFGTTAYVAIDQLKRAQAGFVRRFLAENPRDYDRVAQYIHEQKIAQFPWDTLQPEPAKHLAFVYCFSPYSDTSAVVAAKALAERGRLVDVITNNMNKVRFYDRETSALADRWIAKRTVINAKPSFAGWNEISDFAQQALGQAEHQHALNGGYETVYSRALWVGSHVAALLFKNRHWNTFWTAEFSDPLRRDANGASRPGPVTDNATSKSIKNALLARGIALEGIDTLFDLVELATIVLADELIFTNENQLEYMLSLYDDPAVSRIARSKSVVRHHPMPPKYAYGFVASPYAIPQGVVNVGYFGSFYPNRGIGEVLTALTNLSRPAQRNLRLHVFSNKRQDVVQEARKLGVAPMVYANDYLPYMQFLTATKDFDVLLVNDVERSASLPINPFLPSKYSDYLGAERDIMALVDEGSPLSKMPVRYMAPVGNVSKIREVLEVVANRGISQ